MIRLTTLFFLGAFCALTLLSNKNGRASQAQRGNTGAPGDEIENGQPKTCQNCHNQGPILASMAITVLDTAGNAVTQYMPEQDYIARVTITATGGSIAGYGFQMIGLRDSNNTDLDGFSDVNPNNYKIASIPGGRTYAEHSNISTSNTFNVLWKAPVTGTGSVTFYSSGNGVNGNGGTSGDGAAKASLQLTEFTTAQSEPNTKKPVISVYPNPVVSESTLCLSADMGSKQQVVAFDISGKKVWDSGEIKPHDEAEINLPMSNWAAGTYFIRVEGDKNASSVKVVKL